VLYNSANFVGVVPVVSMAMTEALTEAMTETMTEKSCGAVVSVATFSRQDTCSPTEVIPKPATFHYEIALPLLALLDECDLTRGKIGD
jgi:hypothetical protein